MGGSSQRLTKRCDSVNFKLVFGVDSSYRKFSNVRICLGAANSVREKLDAIAREPFAARSDVSP